MNTGSALARFTITLSAAVTEPVQVEWHTSDGTAKAGVDFAANKGIAVFAPGQTAKTVDILVYGRAVGTEDRSFFVEMLPPTNAILGSSIGECVIHVDTSGSTPVTQIIIPTGPKGDEGESAYQTWLQLPGNAGKTEQEFFDSLKPDPTEFANEVAPLIDVGSTTLTAKGTEAQTYPDETTVKEIARRVAYAQPAAIATVVLSSGDNLIAPSALTGDSVDFRGSGFVPLVRHAGVLAEPSWYVAVDGKLMVRNATAGDTLYAVQYATTARNQSFAREAYTEASAYRKVQSFEKGNKLDQATDVLFYEAEGVYYRWNGIFPKTVAPGSSPASSGGVGVGAWEDIGAATLRSELMKPSGSSLMMFLQSGTDVVPRPVQSKLREFIDLADIGPIDRADTLTAATANTSLMIRALAAAAAAGKPLRMPAGQITVLPFGVPVNLRGLIGRGKYASILKFYRKTYSEGEILINAQYNIAAIEIGRFTIDCDDAAFRKNYLAVLPITGSNNILIDRLRIIGRGDSAIVTQATINGRVNDYTCDCTGAADSTDQNKTFSAAFYGTNCENVIVTNMRTSGYPRYSGQMGISSHCIFQNCYSEGTSGGFGYGFGLSNHCTLNGCNTKNTSHEAFNITESGSCLMIGCHALWEGFNGQDAGMSISGGSTNSARLNIAIGNTFVNSYAAGLMVCGNAQHNLVAFNTVKDCGVRGTNSGGSGTNGCAMGMYTDLPNQQCIGNQFVENTVLTEAAPGTYYGYGEFNLGVGAVIAGTHLRNNKFAGTILTARYLAPSAARRIWDLESIAFTPVITSQGGILSGVTVQAASYHLDGPFVDVSFEFTITNAGTGTGSINVNYSPAPAAEANRGTITGREIGGVNNKMLIGLTAANSVGLIAADGTTAISTNGHYAVNGRYKVAA